MDGPGLDPDRHRQALSALARVNRVSLGAGRLIREVARLAREGVAPVRVLDLACGGGDLLAAVGRWAARTGTEVRLTGADLSALALEATRERCEAAGRSAETVQLDVLHDPMPGRYDLVCSSLFLHHLGPDDAVAVLRAMADVTERTVLVQDLLRTRAGLALAWLGLHTLTRSEVARIDGLRSVRAAFTLQEAQGLAARAGLSGAVVRRCWPERFVLTWRRS